MWSGYLPYGGFESAAAQVFGIAHLRSAIFEFHYVESLSRCPEPAAVHRSRHPKYPADEHFESIAPLLALHGYRSATLQDELQRRPDMLAFHLSDAYQRAKDPTATPFSWNFVSPHTTSYAGEHASLEQVLRLVVPGAGLSNLGLDLAYTRITDAIVRQHDRTSPLLLHSWPRNGQQSCMWKWFFERPSLLRDPACPLLPAVQMFEHGQRSFLVTAAQPCSPRHLSDNMRRRLERVRDVIHAMAWLHQHNVSLNYIHPYQHPFLLLYARPATHQQTKRGPPGKPESYSFTEQLPERPPKSSPDLPWCAMSASDDPRVAGPRNFLHDLQHASVDDDISVTHPMGRQTYDWECEEGCQLHGIHQHQIVKRLIKPSPEVAALLQLPEWSNGTPANVSRLPFCRFKRDVWLVADFLVSGFISDPLVWSNQGDGDGFDFMPRLATTIDSDRYEQVFSMDPRSFSNAGPEEHWRPLDEDSDAGEDDDEWDEPEYNAFALPDSLRKLFIQMLDSDPEKRPTAEEAARRVTEIHDYEVPRIVKVYEDWWASNHPSHRLPLPQTQEEQTAYAEEIASETPPFRLMMEHARGNYLHISPKILQ